MRNFLPFPLCFLLVSFVEILICLLPLFKYLIFALIVGLSLKYLPEQKLNDNTILFLIVFGVFILFIFDNFVFPDNILYPQEEMMSELEGEQEEEILQEQPEEEEGEYGEGEGEREGE